MISIFRRIRKKMADDNHLLKYSKYAIGEIVLVVIGILVALYINNWNENRKGLEKFNNQLIKVQNELEGNIHFCNYVIYSYQVKDSLSDIIRNGLLTPEMLADNNEFANIIYTGDFLVLRDLEFKNLSEMNYALNSSQDSILKLLKSIYIIQKSFVDKLYTEQYNLVMTNYKALAESKSWFNKWVNTHQVPEEAYDFFINDPAYMNHLSLYSMILFKTSLPRTLDIKETSIHAHRSISNYFGKNDTFLKYPVEEYEHFIGLYQGEDASFRVDHEAGKLFLKWQYKNRPSRPDEIFPISKTCFTAMSNNGFYYIRLDENNKVNKIVDSYLMKKDEYIKVQ